MAIYNNIMERLRLCFENNTVAAVLLTLMWSFVYLYAHKRGFKNIAKEWWENIKHNRKFLLVICFGLYASFMLGETMMRGIYDRPVKYLIGFFWLYNEPVKLIPENVGNIIMFVILILLMFLALDDMILSKNSFKYIILKACIISFSISAFFELCQLLFKLGEFQISDLILNPIGGMFGGAIYWTIIRLKGRKETNEF